MNSKKLLIAGGGYADIPQIIAAQNIGYHVVTSGNRPEELGHRISDEYKYADFSNPQQIYKLAKELGVTAICPSCNDFSAISCAYTAEKLNLPGYDNYETSLIIHHKDKYREFAKNNGIPTPKAMGFLTPESALSSIRSFSLPIMVKPIDLTGGKGIKKISNYEDAEKAILDAFSISKSKRIVVEEFIHGSRHGFSALIKNKKICFSFSDNEHYYLNDYMVSSASTPTIVNKSSLTELKLQCEKIASLLSLTDGIFHVQYINQNESPVIVEICRRPPGDLYTKFVQLATKINYPNELLKPFINDELPKNIKYTQKDNHTRHCIMARKNGRVKNVSYDDKIKGKIIEEFVLWKDNNIVESYLTNKLGIIFLEFENQNQMMDLTSNIHKHINIEYF